MGSKIPLRGFTQLLKHLDPAVRARLESAFSDAENLIDFHSRTVPQRQNRRRLSGTIEKPSLFTEATIIGAFVKWKRLDDPRISFYEVQISDDNVFSSPDTYYPLETFFSVENVVTPKYVRVRGVRSNGETGLWSDTTIMRPTFTCPSTRTVEFYPGYHTDSDPTLSNSFRFSGGRSRNKQSFYTLLEDTFYANREIGGVSVWGYISNRMANPKEASGIPWDRVRFSVNGVTVGDGYFPHWVNMMDGDAQLKANEHDFYMDVVGGDPMSFYMRGGYTAAWGPYVVDLPTTFSGDGPNDPGNIRNVANGGGGTFYWEDLNNAKYPSRYDQAQFKNPATANSAGDTKNAAHEAGAYGIEEDAKTDYIYFHDFNFDVPDNSPITGIRAQVKRRQPKIKIDIVSPNAGVRRPDKALGHDVILNWKSNTDANRINEDIDILEDVEYGRYLDCSRFIPGSGSNWAAYTDRGPLCTDARGADSYGTPSNPFGTETEMKSRILNLTTGAVSVSIWMNLNSLAFTGLGAASQLIPIWSWSDPDAAGNGNRGYLQVRASETGGITTIQFLMYDVDGSYITVFGVPTANNGALDAWHHIVCTYSGSGNADELSIYVNDEKDDDWTTSTVSRSTSGGWDGYITEAQRVFQIGEQAFSDDSDAPIKVMQCGIWNTQLTDEAVDRIYAGRGYMDYSKDSGRYIYKDNLQHYFLFFPEQPDIKDNAVYLTNRSGRDYTIRTDLENKSAGDSWPQLSDFFYTDLKYLSWLPLAVSDGIPHDNHTAIGYQTYGGEGDLWGGSFTASQVNDFYFGFVMQAINEPEKTSYGNAYIDHAKMTVYYVPDIDRQITARLEAAAATQFYLEREVFGGLFNMIEIGEEYA